MTSDFKVRKIPSPSDSSQPPIADDLWVFTHDPTDTEEDERNIDSFVPPLDLPLHSTEVTPDLMAKYPDVLKLEHDFNDVKKNLKEIYGVYEDDEKMYGPSAAHLRPDPELHSDKDIDDIVDKYVGVAMYGSDKSFELNPLKPRTPVVSDTRSPDKSVRRCPDCDSVWFEGHKCHGPYRRVYSPAVLPDLPPSPVISTELMPTVPEFDFPDVNTPLPLDPSKIPKSVHFANEVDVQTFTPDPSEKKSGPSGSSGTSDAASKQQLIEKQRKLLLLAIQQDEARKDNQEGEIAVAGYKYDDAMEKLGEKLKKFEDDKDNDIDD